MKILICREKWDDRYYGPFSTFEEREELAKVIVRGRIADGNWYNEELTAMAKADIELNKAWQFLQDQYRREYEEVVERELRMVY